MTMKNPIQYCSINAILLSPCSLAACFFYLRGEQANDIFKFKGAHLQFSKGNQSRLHHHAAICFLYDPRFPGFG
jgi:hypothetical protein